MQTQRFHKVTHENSISLFPFIRLCIWTHSHKPLCSSMCLQSISCRTSADGSLIRLCTCSLTVHLVKWSRMCKAAVGLKCWGREGFTENLSVALEPAACARMGPLLVHTGANTLHEQHQALVIRSRASLVLLISGSVSACKGKQFILTKGR